MIGLNINVFNYFFARANVDYEFYTIGRETIHINNHNNEKYHFNTKNKNFVPRNELYTKSIRPRKIKLKKMKRFNVNMDELSLRHINYGTQ